jgi:hypothetical protein
VTLDVTDFRQAAEKGGEKLGPPFTRIGAEIPDHRHGRPLRPRDERPSRRAAEKRDELAPFHAINS